MTLDLWDRFKRSLYGKKDLMQRVFWNMILRLTKEKKLSRNHFSQSRFQTSIVLWYIYLVFKNCNGHFWKCMWSSKRNVEFFKNALEYNVYHRCLCNFLNHTPWTNGRNNLQTNWELTTEWLTKWSKTKGVVSFRNGLDNMDKTWLQVT